MIQAHIKAHMDTLVAEQATSILNSCGLSSKLSILQSLNSSTTTNNTPSSSNQSLDSSSQTALPLSSILDRKSITDTIQAFESMLVETAGSLFMPQCERLQSSQLRLQARNSVNLVIYHSYQLFYTSVTDPANKVLIIFGSLIF